MKSEYEAIIGLETHIQLNTQSKIFCGCKVDSWEDQPNTNICPVCTGLPGVLPALNQAAVQKAIVLAAAMQAESIQPVSYFSRKNYFYPDLPKGYQISQYDEPLARGGHLDLPLEAGEMRRVNIVKLHIEEDAGKTIHQNGKRLIDFNRCGVPLVEMVTGPDLRSADEAAQYLIRLRQLLRWLAISDADMERGQLRCDANVSIRELGETGLNTKVEIKNLNSIENTRKAIETEIERQIREVEAGNEIQAWTLDWNDETEKLSLMRSKETAADYRYFREPDLLPIHISQEWKSSIIEDLPELPLERKNRFVQQYGIPEYDAEILTEERSLSSYFEQAVSQLDGNPKSISNWMMNDVLRLIHQEGVRAADLKLRPEHLVEIVAMVESGAVTASTGKALLEQVQESGRPPAEIVEAEGLGQVSDEDALRELAIKVIEANPDQAHTFREGKTTLLGWFVGQLMKETKGKANPQIAQDLLKELLEQ
jgi:aspartyl-tRNA(Asn)/glutamyl-tRNA(Gln) amidotransferase subunit B